MIHNYRTKTMQRQGAYQVARRLGQLQRLMSPAARGRRNGCSPVVSQIPTTAGSQPASLLHQASPDDDGDVPYPLNQDEAFNFLENKLGMKQPREQLRGNRKGFLDEFVLQMNLKMPFSNLIFTSKQDLTSITCPTLQECKEAMLNLLGGNCYYINVFSKALLDLLGFKTFHIGAKNPGEGAFETHISTIVSDLTFPGSQHLVDPGTIRPLYKAIPLDFEEESPIYEFNYMKVKFFKRDHGILLSCSEVPEPETPSPNIFECGGRFWKLELTYRLQAPRSRRYFLRKMKYEFNFPTQDPYIYRNVRLFGYISDKCVFMGFTDFGMTVKYQHSDPKQSEMMVLSMDEFSALMEREYPQFPRKMIENALVNTEYVRNMYNY